MKVPAPHSGLGALLPQPHDVPCRVVHFVQLKHGELHLLILVDGLLGSRVRLLLTLLGSAAAPEPQKQVESGLLLDAVFRQGAAVLELLPGETQALLIGWDPFLVLAFTLSTVSEDSTSRVMVFPDRIFTKICMLLVFFTWFGSLLPTNDDESQ